jgi:hypothetical protein
MIEDADHGCIDAVHRGLSSRARAQRQNGGMP